MSRFMPLVPFALLSLTACQPQPVLNADKAYVNMPAVPGQPAAAYFTLHGGPVDDRLLEVTSEVAIRAELHESMAMAAPAGGAAMTTMKPLESGVALPKNSIVEFKPGGKHVMLIDVNPHLIRGKPIPLLLTFASGTHISVDATVNRPGDSGPKP
jgi:periplasmic copper chaperone A